MNPTPLPSAAAAPPPRRPLRRLGRALALPALLLGSALLGACGDLAPQAPQPDAAARHDYVATVEVAAGDTREGIATQHNAEVVVWRPDAGFAVLGLREGAGSLGTLSASSNQDAIRAPEAHAAGISAWAGGVSAWAGGVSAWAGGVSAWAGGSTNPFPGNEHAWQQIDLGFAQDLAPHRGAGVKVAVIDTGLDLRHSGFHGRLAPQHEWLDLVDNDNWPQDAGDGAAFGHGTAVAGIVLQAAPNATLLPIRVLGPDGSGDITAVAQAIDHAVAQGAEVINLSLGALSDVDALRSMVKYAVNQGVYVVASSGNSGDSQVTYPAAWGDRSGRVIGVGSVDARDVKSRFSTYGSQLDLFAPGENVSTLFPGERTVAASGTSFAAPFAAGVVALALGETLHEGMVGGYLNASAASLLHANPTLGGLLGHGRLDGDGTVRLARGL